MHTGFVDKSFRKDIYRQMDYLVLHLAGGMKEYWNFSFSSMNNKTAATTKLKDKNNTKIYKLNSKKHIFYIPAPFHSIYFEEGVLTLFDFQKTPV